MLWVTFVVLLLAALGFVVWPLLRNTARSSALLTVAIVATVALSVGLYYRIGNPGVPSGAGTAPDIDEMVASLAIRLQQQPDDIKGWKMLGQSYQTMRRFEESIAAYEKAIQLEDGQNAETLVSLSLVLLDAQGGVISARATGLLENALALDANNPQALFYGGFAAANRGDTALAADRWEMLLGLNAPPEIRTLLQEKIDEWRGVKTAAVDNFDVIVSAHVSLAVAARAALPPEATVFVIARDPHQPSPPIAVARRRLSELPLTVQLSDRESMVPGRLLSAFPQFELLVRVSISGAPIAKSGDWFGATLFDVGESHEVTLVVDQEVP